MKTISVAMIVKNEQPTLARALKCAKSFADEIIVVDTGSTDESVNIAKSFTDKVYFFDWQDDFSAARNFALKNATCDYFLWLDADDYIDDGNIEKIKKLKKTDLYADFYMFLYRMMPADCTDGCKKTEVGAKSGQLEFYRERLIKNGKGFFFIGAVHEAVPTSGAVKYTDIVIEHRKVKTNAPMRNLKIYENLLLRGHVFTPRETYYFARELYYNGMYDRAKNCFEKFISGDGYAADMQEAHILLCDIYLKQKNYSAAGDIIFSALKKYCPYPEMLAKVGEVCFLKGEYRKSAQFYRAATVADPPCQGFNRGDYKTIIPYLMLTVIYYRLEDFKAAAEWHLRAKQVAPDNPSVIFNDKIPCLGG